MRQCRVCVATEIQATEFGIPREVARKVARDRVDGPSLPEELAEDCVR